MAMGTLGERMWRLLRRIELHPTAPGPVPWDELRAWGRQDDWHRAVLLHLGLIAGGVAGYQLTPAGREAARFGEIEAERLTAAWAAVKGKVAADKAARKKANARLARRRKEPV